MVKDEEKREPYISSKIGMVLFKVVRRTSKGTYDTRDYMSRLLAWSYAPELVKKKLS
jgi:hypothetical protein